MSAIDRGADAPERSTAAIMRVENVVKQFGGLTAVGGVSLDVPRALDRLGDRAQRRRQDDPLQHAHRALQADLRADPVRRPRHQPHAPGP